MSDPVTPARPRSAPRPGFVDDIGWGELRNEGDASLQGLSLVGLPRRAPASPAQFVRVVACAVRGPSPNRSAPQAGGRFGRGAKPPSEDY